jgi:hypothetical protein
MDIKRQEVSTRNIFSLLQAIPLILRSRWLNYPNAYGRHYA